MFSSACRLSFHVYALPLSIHEDPSYDELLSVVIAGGVLALYRDMKCNITDVTMNVKAITLFLMKYVRW